MDIFQNYKNSHKAAAVNVAQRDTEAAPNDISRTTTDRKESETPHITISISQSHKITLDLPISSGKGGVAGRLEKSQVIEANTLFSPVTGKKKVKKQIKPVNPFHNPKLLNTLVYHADSKSSQFPILPLQFYPDCCLSLHDSLGSDPLHLH